MTADNRYDSLFQFYAEAAGLDWKDLKAQARQESQLNPMARSGAGALGLAQFMPATFREWADRLHLGGTANPYNPEHAIICQAAYMQHLKERYPGDYQKALAAYNWGMGNVDKTDAAGYPDETKNYLLRIASYRADLG